MAKHKTRLDQLLVQRGMAETRSKAQALILAGSVRIGGAAHTKAGELVPDDAELELAAALPYASRGGYKLAHALDAFALDPAGLLALDVGASTGGFTSVLLQRSAARVYAVDVGYGIIDWRLRQDPRVVVIERTNIRYLEALPGDGEREMEDRHVEVLPANELGVPGDQPQVAELLQQDPGWLRLARWPQRDAYVVVAAEVAGQVEQQPRGTAHAPVLRINQYFHVRLPYTPTSL